MALEELLKHLMQTGDINTDHTQVLFERFTQKIPETTDHESRIAVHLIGMLGSADRRLILDNMDTLIQVGLCSRSQDTRLVEQTCIALQKVSIEKPKAEDSVHSYRLDKGHKMFLELNRILIDGLANLEDTYYVPMSEEALKVIYKLAENPDVLCEDILRDMMRYVLTFEANLSDSKENEDVNTQSTTNSGSTQALTHTSTQSSTQQRGSQAARSSRSQATRIATATAAVAGSQSSTASVVERRTRQATLGQDSDSD